MISCCKETKTDRIPYDLYSYPAQTGEVEKLHRNFHCEKVAVLICLKQCIQTLGVSAGATTAAETLRQMVDEVVRRRSCICDLAEDKNREASLGCKPKSNCWASKPPRSLSDHARKYPHPHVVEV
ncbi:hypothetical protein J6590_097354 [Homalodisca vitripennis]|nr:hypothetical protein J6590_095906 [Homalodisca vitripennis]KAG8334123.1 hypothetical protein J6590_097354 [Homalodisca vitripennis]